VLEGKVLATTFRYSPPKAGGRAAKAKAE